MNTCRSRVQQWCKWLRSITCSDDCNPNQGNAPSVSGSKVIGRNRPRRAYGTDSNSVEYLPASRGGPMTPEQIVALGPAFTTSLEQFEFCCDYTQTFHLLEVSCRGLLSDLQRKSA